MKTIESLPAYSQIESVLNSAAKEKGNAFVPKSKENHWLEMANFNVLLEQKLQRNTDNNKIT